MQSDTGAAKSVKPAPKPNPDNARQHNVQNAPLVPLDLNISPIASNRKPYIKNNKLASNQIATSTPINTAWRSDCSVTPGSSSGEQVRSGNKIITPANATYDIPKVRKIRKPFSQIKKMKIASAGVRKKRALNETYVIKKSKNKPNKHAN
ncbi:unnamed protein product [Trichobilharzia szidati]|nr:unnamed protein product [Trichobilharzia szidati]